MKKTTSKPSFKKIALAAFLSFSLMGTAFTGHAAAKPAIEILSGENSNLVLVSTADDALLFKLNVNNVAGEKFIITIKNDAGDILFSKSFDDVNFVKQFKVLKNDEQDNTRYYVSISSSNQTLENTYVVTSSQSVVNNVYISKL